MCLRFFIKLYLILWKSGVHSIRHNLLKTIFDIFVPVAFFLLLTVSRAEYEKPETNAQSIRSSFEEKFFTPPYGPRLSPVVAYSPNISVFNDLISSIEERYDNDTKITHIGVDTAENLENLLMQNGTIIAGIQFNHPDNITEIPDNFNFSLRFPAMMRWYNTPWPTQFLYKEQMFHRFPREAFDWNFYRKEGFATLQLRITSLLHVIDHANKTVPARMIAARQFPDYPENLNFDKFQYLFPSLILISFYYTYLNTICCIVAERKRQTLELMKLMGISNWFYWLSVYLQKMLLQVVTVTIIIALMKTRLGYSKAVFENSDFLLLWEFFVVYCLCFTSLAFLLSIFFTDIKLAISVSTIVWFASFLPFCITHIDYKLLPDHLKTAVYFSPNSAMGFGIKLIFQLELMLDNGLDRSTLWNDGLFPYDILCIGKIMSIMLYTSIVFLGIFIYVIPIFPGRYGVAAPVYYLFTKDFWSKRRIRSRERTRQRELDEDFSNFENELENRTPGIRIRKLTKRFAKGKAAVRNLSLNIYKNQVTVVCGPNSCGKTTLMLMLTGMMKATSGVALIDGYDINKKTNSARKSIGFCPQQSVLLEGLTAREHLLFYSLIKGSKRKTAYADMKKYSKLLEFDNELNVDTSKLSYGTQRKLAIALAFCGKSQFVFLDHPSHSLDPAARQLFWTFLSLEKQERHILMTTHIPDEVDVIADRIAFMADGELKFCGSSIFVRQRYGAYRLLCIKGDDCKSSTTTRFLDQYFPGITIETETKGQLSYLLNYNKLQKFGRFFEKLESFYVTQLKLKSFRISIATTEFLFNEFADDSASSASSIKSLEIEDYSESECPCGMTLIPYQVSAMLMKRFLCGIRKWRSFVLYHLIVIVMMIPIAYDLNLRTLRNPNPPPFEISLDSYKNSDYCFLETNETFDDSIFGVVRRNISNGYRGMFGTRLITINVTELGIYAQTFGVQKYRYNFLIGASVREIRRFVYANTFSALHAFPISLKYYMASRLFPVRNVTVINEPLKGNTTAQQATSEYLNMEAFGMDFPIFIGILAAVMSSEHIIFYIKEKRHGTKIKQYINGVNHFIFWLTSIVWDSVISIVAIVGIVVWLYISGRAFWSEIGTLYIVASILFVFNLAMVPIVCSLSLIFSEAATGVSTLCALNMFLCMMIFVNHYGVQFIPGPVTQALSVIPLCALIECFIKLSTIAKRCSSQCDDVCDKESRKKLCEDYPMCCPTLSLSWTDSDIRRELLFMTFTGLTTFLILLAVEHEIFKQSISYAWNCILRPSSFTKDMEQSSEVEDDDSKDSINLLSSEDSIGDGQQMNSCFGSIKSAKFEERVNMHNVSKYHGRRLAVDEISLTLQLGECVGLIGKNGKGKTTMFKMLTGEHRICYGKASLFGLNSKWNTRKTHDLVGYCPQSDQLWGNLTVCETLRFFCLLRGTEYDETADLAHNLNLSRHFTQKVSRLSGGSRQILSIVIALIGYPRVILIDVATTCIDDRTRRTLWTILNRLCDAGKSILLSSDNMQEYQSLCTRFTLAEDDDLSVVESKPTSIEILIESSMAEYIVNNNSIVEFMKSSFKEAKLRSILDNFLTFEITYSPNVLSKLFTVFEKRKRQLCIENYYVSLK